MLDTLGTLERTHTCGELRETHVGQQVVLMGWVAKKRDFGVFTFIDLRDREGVTQIVVSSETFPDAHRKRRIFAVSLSSREGRSRVACRRDAQREARDRVTSRSKVSELLILNDAKVPPFQLEVAGSRISRAKTRVSKYRYLDLRRPQLQNNIRMRAKAVRAIP
jgi:aspartyl-tRNA synthetase